MHAKAANKTTICTVVFLDIVEYTKKSVAEQIKLKERFNGMLSHAIKHVPLTDRIILDTGDGAAISFLGDPEDALLAAMKLRDSLLAKKPEEIEFFVRIGINLGPARLVQDINQQPNIIGDGINVAQRVMSFAQPNQILVSRSFYEVISCMTDDYAKLFEYQGSRTDKHVREHEIYSVKSEFTQEDVLRASSRHHRDEPKKAPPAASAAPAATPTGVPWWSDRNILLKRVLPVSAVAIVLLAVTVRMTRTPEKPAPQLAQVEAPAQLQPGSAPQSVAPRKEDKKKDEKPKETQKEEKLKEAKSEAKAKAKIEREKHAAEKTATLVFKILPWGEVYLDGQIQGISPPLKTLTVKPGLHLIEVRNTSFQKFSQSVEPNPDEQVIIKHKFQ